MFELFAGDRQFLLIIFRVLPSKTIKIQKFHQIIFLLSLSLSRNILLFLQLAKRADSNLYLVRAIGVQIFFRLKIDFIQIVTLYC